MSIRTWQSQKPHIRGLFGARVRNLAHGAASDKGARRTALRFEGFPGEA
jgi:hypothetical protein